MDKGTDFLTLAVDATDPEALIITCAPEGEEGITYYCDEEVTFSQLNPGTKYTITVDTIQFRHVEGTMGGTAVTASVTEVLTFEITDNEDGSHSANFSVSGPEPEAWMITATAEGHEPLTFSAKNHSCLLTGLQPETDYILTLDAGAGYYVSGLTATTFSFTQPVIGSDLAVEEVTADSITVVWNAEGTAPTTWTAVCSGDNGYANTLEVSECRAVFENTSVSAEYTIAVSNPYMSMPMLITVDCPAGEVTNFSAEAEGNAITVSWEAEGLSIPEEWTLTYGIETMDSEEDISVSGSSITLEDLLPNATYTITLSDPEGRRITGTMECTAKTEAAAEYEGSLPALFPGLFSKPAGETWDSTQLANAKVTFKPAEPIVFALEPVPKPAMQEEPVDVEVMIIIRTEDGEPLAFSTETFSFNDMWKNKLFATCIDTVPSEAGSYTIELYFDGMLLKTRTFQIAE